VHLVFYSWHPLWHVGGPLLLVCDLQPNAFGLPGIAVGPPPSVYHPGENACAAKKPFGKIFRRSTAEASMVQRLLREGLA